MGGCLLGLILEDDDSRRPLRTGGNPDHGAQLLFGDPVLVPDLYGHPHRFGRPPDHCRESFRCLVECRRVDPIPRQVGRVSENRRQGNLCVIGIHQLEDPDLERFALGLVDPVLIATQSSTLDNRSRCIVDRDLVEGGNGAFGLHGSDRVAHRGAYRVESGFITEPDHDQSDRLLVGDHQDLTGLAFELGQVH
jgi:hypothetical protein